MSKFKFVLDSKQEEEIYSGEIEAEDVDHARDLILEELEKGLSVQRNINECHSANVAEYESLSDDDKEEVDVETMLQDPEFEEYLKDIHFKNNPQILDDDLSDAFDHWVTTLQPKDCSKYLRSFQAAEEQKEMLERNNMNKELEMNEEMLCPKCNAKITYLVETRFSEAYYHVYPAGDTFDATLQEYGDDFKEAEYHCPDCDALLATGEENAKILFTNPMNNPEHIELLNEKLKQDEQDNLKQEYEEQ